MLKGSFDSTSLMHIWTHRWGRLNNKLRLMHSHAIKYNILSFGQIARWWSNSSDTLGCRITLNHEIKGVALDSSSWWGWWGSSSIWHWCNLHSTSSLRELIIITNRTSKKNLVAFHCPALKEQTKGKKNCTTIFIIIKCINRSEMHFAIFLLLFVIKPALITDVQGLRNNFQSLWFK